MSREKRAISVRLHDYLLKNLLSSTKDIIGKLLTITDSITSDSIQRKALKNLVESAVWDSHHYRRKDLDYYMEKLANAINEDAEWNEYQKKPDEGDHGPKKPYNPLTA